MARVLVVDDNHDACELLARIMRRTGHDASCRTSARAALTYLAGHTPDLIIADVMMPEMTGLELLKALRAEPRTASIPVIIFTALSDEKTRGDAARLGANGYIVKGGGWTPLQAEIEKHLGARPDAG